MSGYRSPTPASGWAKPFADVSSNRFSPRKKRGRGTGLGLASAYGIVKNHGGMITVYSVEGKGSIFNIYLPASKTQATEQTASPAVLHQGEGLILLIDDEEMMLNVGCRMLEIMGYQVMTASSGEEAMNRYRDCKGFSQKPFAFQQLSEKIGEIISDSS